MKLHLGSGMDDLRTWEHSVGIGLKNSFTKKAFCVRVSSGRESMKNNNTFEHQEELLFSVAKNKHEDQRSV